MSQSQPMSAVRSLFSNQPWSNQRNKLGQNQNLSQSSRSTLRAPVVTPEQRAQRNEWNRNYRRQLQENRRIKNEAEGKFMVNLKEWIRFGVIEPGVNVLKYKDPEGNRHRASILRNGKVQAVIAGDPVFPSVHAWLKSVLKLEGYFTNRRLEWEMKRVFNHGRSFFEIFGAYKKIKDEMREEEEPDEEIGDEWLYIID